MIRINLLPVRAVKKAEAGRKQLMIFAVLVLAAVVGNYFWVADRNEAREKLEAQVTSLQKEIADLDRIIGEVKNITKEKQQLEDKLGVLDTLKRGRTGPVKMLDAMTVAIPKNVWLRAMNEANGAMALEGSAVSNEDIAEYMKALSNVVWTPEGIGRYVEEPRKGDVSVRVELSTTGQVQEFSLKQIASFFSNITLKKASMHAAAGKDKDDPSAKVVDFALSLSANYAI